MNLPVNLPMSKLRKFLRFMFDTLAISFLTAMIVIGAFAAAGVF